QQLVRLLVQASRGRSVEGMGHRRVDPLPTSHEGAGEDRGGGGPVGIVMTEHADPRDTVHEGCGRSSPFEEPGRRQVLEALPHRATYFTWSSETLDEQSQSAGRTPCSL